MPTHTAPATLEAAVLLAEEVAARPRQTEEACNLAVALQAWFDTEEVATLLTEDQHERLDAAGYGD